MEKSKIASLLDTVDHATYFGGSYAVLSSDDYDTISTDDLVPHMATGDDDQIVIKLDSPFEDEQDIADALESLGMYSGQ